jgi:hypothetical protein
MSDIFPISFMLDSSNLVADQLSGATCMEIALLLSMLGWRQTVHSIIQCRNYSTTYSTVICSVAQPVYSPDVLTDPKPTSPVTRSMQSRPSPAFNGVWCATSCPARAPMGTRKQLFFCNRKGKRRRIQGGH